jgi:hypothetical protein
MSAQSDFNTALANLDAAGAALSAENTQLQTELDASEAALAPVQASLTELKGLAQAYLDAPNGQDEDEQAALEAFLTANP